MSISPSYLVLLRFISTFELYFLIYAKPAVEQNAIQFSGDFNDFLKDMGTIVYKKDERMKDMNKRTILAYPHEIEKNTVEWNPPRNNNMLGTQKAALRDVLMMKLVSYYEDKYKLAQNRMETTINPFTEPYTNVITRRNLNVIFNPMTTENPLNVIDYTDAAEVVVI